MEFAPSRHADDLHTAIGVAGLTPAEEAFRDTSDTTTSSPKLDQPLPISPQTQSWELRDDELMATVFRRDGRSPGRRMDDEAIAGTAVGVVLAFALLVCCLYPLVVHYLKKRRRSKPYSWECEYGTTYRGQPRDRPRRLSSSDKTDDEGKSQQNYNSQNGYVYSVEPAQGQARPPATGYDASAIESTAAEPQLVPQNHDNFSTPFPYYQDTVPPPPSAPNQFVLKGTSEDYYSPYVPSEAFGMYPPPAAVIEPPSEPQRSAQRGTSLRHNVRSLLRRKAVPDQPEAAPHSIPYSDYTPVQGHQFPVVPQSSDTVQYAQFYPTQQMEGTPMHSQYPQYYRVAGSAVEVPTMQGYASQDTFQASSSELDFSFGLPIFGTVNPMDIMPPATESEIWHRADYQLYSSSNQDSPPEMPSSIELVQPDGAAPPVSVVAPASISIREDLPPVSNPGPSTTIISSRHATSSQQPVPPPVAPESTPDPSSTSTLSATQSVPTSRLSAQPASVPGACSTNPSTLSTPSTHGDTPSPRSLNSSDFRQSISPPNGMNAPSPKGGVYHCDERGCNQFFDQPHKLKHHQRYHSKDHKCPYAGCGKGFGTKTHLQRHINDRHEKKKKFHCSMPGCDYSRTGGKAFPRKDNWKRHMVKIHGMDQGSLPEPVEVDQEMTGA
ncbi:unnamed protein product [Clonostachys rosea f. rosea IK726]|uniref:C2H2-type domain-containing protein n=2 Tax=Bionectria ochroleuca TaxID=29856 RepID=A0A0B7K0G5_BIOOC|nr:unnamed protein product [Clonostachys rosea f. rosea IK726]